ncbi:MAG TPA: PstS family phosphate ABC transporter substrate-binding protein [Nitrospiraceae bacterium]|nr:PstS family phosphate ABC transporter substrate-binding protein [Nitrospiraceae bacterium]
MTSLKTWQVLAATTLVMGALCWVTLPSQSQPAALVKIDGSSTVFPITEAVAEEFQNANRGAVRVTVGISGTGGGFKKFCRRETDVQDASRPILTEEMDVCRKNGVQYHELPVAFDAMTIVVSHHNTWAESITVDELKKMWEPSAQGRITKWNQIRSSWPDLPLKLFGAGSDSGTFDYFTEAIVGKAKASRGDYTASEDDNTLVQGIANDKHALGYIPLAYFEPNKKKLKAIGVDESKGPVLPSPQTVEDGTYRPLSRPIFIYVNSTSAKRSEVKSFVEFYLTNAATLVAQVKYVPLPPEAYRLAREHFQDGKLGTAFQGTSTVGLKIEDLLRREAKL